jgi:hypothetical protein
MADVDPRFTERRMLNLAGRAISKIDVRGRRATERLTYDEIEAMAAALVCLGLRPLKEGQG